MLIFKKKLWPLLLLSSVIFVARCVQRTFFIDAFTGYGTNGVVDAAVSITLALFAALIVILVTAKPSEIKPDFSLGEWRVGIRLASGLCAAGFFVLMLLTLLLAERPWKTTTVAIPCVLCLLCVVFFVTECVTGGPLKRRALLTVIGPVGYYAYRLVTVFSRLTLNTEVQGYRFLLLGMGLVLVFFSRLGRMLLDGTCAKSGVVAGCLAFLFLSSSSAVSLTSQLFLTCVFCEEVPIYVLAVDFSVMLYILSILKNISVEHAVRKKLRSEKEAGLEIEDAKT